MIHNTTNINDMLISNVIKLIDNSREFIALNINTFEILDFSTFSNIIKETEFNNNWVWFKLNKNNKIKELFLANNNNVNIIEKEKIIKKAKIIIKFMIDYKDILDI